MTDNLHIVGRGLAGPAFVSNETGLLHVGTELDATVLEGRASVIVHEFVDMDKDTTQFISLDVGKGELLLRFFIVGLEAFEFPVSEAAVVTGGTPLIVGNLNRAHPPELITDLTATLNPTVNDPGLLLFRPLSYGGGFKTAGLGETPLPFIPKPNTTYLLSIANGDKAQSLHLICLVFALFPVTRRPEDRHL